MATRMSFIAGGAPGSRPVVPMEIGTAARIGCPTSAWSLSNICEVAAANVRGHTICLPATWGTRWDILLGQSVGWYELSCTVAER